MELIISVLFVVFGTIMGSFLTVVGNRLPNKKSIIKPGSHCDDCQHKLKWFEMIPIFSYIFLRGKCRYCGKKISNQCLIIELICGLLYGVSYYVVGYSFELYILLIITSLLITIYVSDFNYLIILDEALIISGILIFVVNVIFISLKGAFISLLSGACLFFIMIMIKIIGDKLFKKESLGGGDIKLAIIMGMVLGLKLGLISLVVASFLAFPYALLLTVKKKEKEIPFGPFLISSTFIIFLFSDFFRTVINYLVF